MSTALHVLALVVAILSVPSVAALTAWGLAGGDGEAKNPLVGLLGALVALGSVYVAVTCWSAFWGLSEWRWWLMFVPPAAGVLGLLLHGDDGFESSLRDRLLGLVLQAVLLVPPLLLWAAGLVSPG